MGYNILECYVITSYKSSTNGPEMVGVQRAAAGWQDWCAAKIDEAERAERLNESD